MHPPHWLHPFHWYDAVALVIGLAVTAYTFVLGWVLMRR
jgi:hypothetical protein